MDTMEKASDYAQEAAGKVASASAQTAKVLGEKGEQLLNAEQRLMKRSCNYVSEHPMASLGMAVAVGFFLNHLFSDR